MADHTPSLAQRLAWRLEAFGFDLLGLFFRLMPIDTASHFGGAILRRLGPLTGTHKVAERNLRIAFPGMDRAERQRLLVAQWDNLGRLTAEFR